MRTMYRPVPPKPTATSNDERQAATNYARRREYRTGCAQCRKRKSRTYSSVSLFFFFFTGTIGNSLTLVQILSLPTRPEDTPTRVYLVPVDVLFCFTVLFMVISQRKPHHHTYCNITRGATHDPTTTTTWLGERYGTVLWGHPRAACDHSLN
jgi:hypothetical protein